MASKRLRVHPKYKTKYRVRNWSTYDRALVQRGDITGWFTPDAITASTPTTTGKRGAQAKYSDFAIETAPTLRLVFNLALRQTEGLLNSLLSLMGLELCAPDHTTLSRRRGKLNVPLRVRRSSDRIHPFVDSTGLKIFGQGEWAAAKHGGRVSWSSESSCPRFSQRSRQQNSTFIAQRLQDQCIRGHGWGSERGISNPGTANPAKLKRPSIATKPSAAQRCEREGSRRSESRRASPAAYSIG